MPTLAKKLWYATKYGKNLSETRRLLTIFAKNKKDFFTTKLLTLRIAS
jgi:hypothetical protein